MLATSLLFIAILSGTSGTAAEGKGAVSAWVGLCTFILGLAFADVSGNAMAPRRPRPLICSPERRAHARTFSSPYVSSPFSSSGGVPARATEPGA